jgi:hypothetical protein
VTDAEREATVRRQLVEQAAPGYRSALHRSVEVEEAFLAAHPPERILVRRTWRERLFSRPWRPLVASRVTWNDPYVVRRTAVLWRRVRRDLEGSMKVQTDEYALLARTEGGADGDGMEQEIDAFHARGKSMVD